MILKVILAELRQPSDEARPNKRVVHFSYRYINSSCNHDEKLIYSVVFNFFVGACAPIVLYIASPLRLPRERQIGLYL
jgi:hypothetical protein